MATRGLKRPRDPSQLGKLIVDIATGQADDRAPAEEESPASNFAKKGSKARAAKLSAKRGVRGVKDTRFHSHLVQRPSKSKSARVTADRRFQGHRNSGLP
jgi:hypothetical protein